MEKTISIIIPTYNVEKYLSRCLVSVLNHKWDKDIEVIIVNDGSTDGSLDIALEYQKEYPLVLTIIDKKNGNYGSTINVALPIAKGKYIKILDADDWFGSEEFGYFIEQLKNIDSDLIITDYTINYISGKKKKIYHKVNIEYDTNYDFSIMLHSSKLLNLQMHAVSYRTELLRSINYKQTEDISYTDLEWVFYPMFFIKTIKIINIDLYQYFVGREGQTVNLLVTLKNIRHYFIIVDRMCSYYSCFELEKLSKNRNKFVLNKINILFGSIYRLSLIYQDKKDFDANLLQEFEKGIKKKSKIIYDNAEKIIIHKLIPFPIVRYWRIFFDRLPESVLFILRLLRKLHT
jgi:glycosyltransferase involved in cell wall biosynthesis